MVHSTLWCLGARRARCWSRAGLRKGRGWTWLKKDMIKSTKFVGEYSFFIYEKKPYPFGRRSRMFRPVRGRKSGQKSKAGSSQAVKIEQPKQLVFFRQMECRVPSLNFTSTVSPDTGRSMGDWRSRQQLACSSAHQLAPLARNVFIIKNHC